MPKSQKSRPQIRPTQIAVSCLAEITCDRANDCRQVFFKYFRQMCEPNWADGV